MRFGTSLVALVLPLALLAGCSGDEEPAEPAGESSASAPPPAENKGCQAQVEVTGAVSSSWKGKAEVIKGSGGPDAIFMSENDGAVLTVYSTGEGFEQSATFGVDGRAFTTEQGAAGVEADAQGKSATVDAEALGVAQDAVQIVASFDC